MGCRDGLPLTIYGAEPNTHIVRDHMMSDANKYRCEAEECRRNAERALRPTDRDAWLRLAADWAKLAEGAELILCNKDVPRGTGNAAGRARSN